MQNRLLYVTAGSMDEARQIGRALVEERLVACVNLIDGMTSIYRWQGAVEEGSEVVDHRQDHGRARRCGRRARQGAAQLCGTVRRRATDRERQC